jgi:hypothetical protein
MLEKPPASPIPADWAPLLAWLWVLGVSILGGFASFLRKMKHGHVRAWNVTELLGEMTAAALTGIITANLCAWLAYPDPLKYALVGITSHMGSKFLFMLERLAASKLHVPTTAPEESPDEARTVP